MTQENEPAKKNVKTQVSFAFVIIFTIFALDANAEHTPAYKPDTKWFSDDPCAPYSCERIILKYNNVEHIYGILTCEKKKGEDNHKFRIYEDKIFVTHLNKEQRTNELPFSGEIAEGLLSEDKSELKIKFTQKGSTCNENYRKNGWGLLGSMITWRQVQNG